MKETTEVGKKPYIKETTEVGKKPYIVEGQATQWQEEKGQTTIYKAYT